MIDKNWFCIVTKENRDILSKWRELSSGNSIDIGKLVGVSYDGDGIFRKGHNPARSIKGGTGTYSYDFGKEITFEQFKEFILKEKSQESIYEIY